MFYYITNNQCAIGGPAYMVTGERADATKWVKRGFRHVPRYTANKNGVGHSRLPAWF